MTSILRARPTGRVAALLRTAVLGAALLGTSLGALPPPASAATAAVVLEPAKLERGPDVAVPHVEGRTLVDGERRVEVPGGRVSLLGATGESFLLRTSRADGSRGRILRLDPDDTTEVLLTGRDTTSVLLTADGRRLVQATVLRRPPTRVSVWSARTGTLRERHRLPGHVTVLDADATRAVVTSDGDTSWLDLRTGGLSRIVARSGGVADIATDRLSTLTGDPYDGGCTVVARLSRPRAATWRSCQERVDSFSPDGTRMTTIDLLADGIGPSRVWVREVAGELLGRYRTAWFGPISWESDDAVLLQVNGRRNASVVRCRGEVCENATDPGPVPTPRPSRSERAAL